MRTMRTAFVMMAAAAGCGDNTAKPIDAPVAIDAPSVDAGQTPVERGRYLMNNVAACTFCHTPLNPDGTRDNTRLFAGVDCLVDIPPCFGQPTCMSAPDPSDGFGCISSRNLTNDATGLKNATDAQIKDALLNGHRVDGKMLAPVMPFYLFHNMTDADANAIVAYIRTLTPVVHTVKPNEEPWASMNNASTPSAQPIDPATIPMPVSTFPDQAAALRGRYLTSQVGLCIDCHTKDAMAAIPLDTTKFFQGGRQFTKEQLGLTASTYPAVINTRNLTPDATGLMGWTTQQLKDAISKGKDQMGKAVCAATHGGVTASYAALEPSDLSDIVSYLQSLAPKVNDTSPDCMGPPVP